VRQYLWLFKDLDVEDYLILSGDHLYRMDYRQFVQQHHDSNADITLSVLPIGEERASSFGLMNVDQTGRIVSFQEKPEGDALRKMQVDTGRLGLSEDEAKRKPYIASMGIYLFKRQVLIDLIDQWSECTDFGKEIIPYSIQDRHVQAYLFDGYWEDIGTMESFFKANLALAEQPDPAFSFYESGAPIYTRARYLPPTKQLECHVYQSMISEGSILKECTILNSVVGIRTRIESGCVIKNSLIMGSDYYESDFERRSNCDRTPIFLGIGANSEIENAIIDKNARIGCDVKILNKDRIDHADREDDGFCIRNGIVIVLKDAVIPDRTVI